MLGFLFVDPDALRARRGRRRRRSATTRRPVLDAAGDGARPGWRTGRTRRSRTALRGALVDGLGLKPKMAFTPVRVAVTGRRVSPPLFESMELLGRDLSLASGCAALRARLAG